MSVRFFTPPGTSCLTRPLQCTGPWALAWGRPERNQATDESGFSRPEGWHEIMVSRKKRPVQCSTRVLLRSVEASLAPHIAPATRVPPPTPGVLGREMSAGSRAATSKRRNALRPRSGRRCWYRTADDSTETPSLVPNDPPRPCNRASAQLAARHFFFFLP